MKKRLFLYTTLIMFAGLLSYFAVSVYATYTNNYNLAKDAVIETTQVCADLYAEDIDLAEFVQAGNDTRITVISEDGKVLADSRPLNFSELESHLDRPEIVAAAAGTPEAFVRHSDTVGADLIYYALKVDAGAGAGNGASVDGGNSDGANAGSYVYLRTAVEVEKIETYLLQLLPILVLLLVVVALLCFVFARSMISRITRPLEGVEKNLRSLVAGDYQPEALPESFEEIDKITRSMDEVAGTLEGSFKALRDERAKLDYIINNIGDGLVVVDVEKSIVLINTAALDIFKAGTAVADKNLNYLTNDKTITEAMNACAAHSTNSTFELTLEGRIYFVAVKRLPKTSLTMAVFADVTENRENAKRREEFFANASHELKTPLTAIRGFNELTALNNSDKSIRKYIDSITRETDRMLSLINDMLKLSELDNTADIRPAPVSLASTVDEVLETLAASAEQSPHVEVEVSADLEVTAEPGHLYDLVKNLVENAVRYTAADGRVSIRIVAAAGADAGADGGTSESGSGSARAQLVISDNGIGISPDDQTRIFERFYRAEKSRSLQNGGTGLGLAIVKHICLLYGWELNLSSKPGIGTQVIVGF